MNPICQILKPHVAIGYVGARQVQDNNTKAWILDPVSPEGEPVEDDTEQTAEIASTW